MVQDLYSIVSSSKVLVVGAGGIGCELLKNLVLFGFQDIVVIDLDTIDVSNLNRQFLFRKVHVGKPKAVVAKESALHFKASAKIIAHHDSITNPCYDVDFFKGFSVVMNALDNKAARSHVNRMCLAADVPLIESGTAGYLGQVSVIKKGETECYECVQKTGQKTYPGCTIRNTPSEAIHCVVWAKHLFNQLFGEEDPDEDVSPDIADPELGGETNAEKALSNMNDKGEVQRMSTRLWAMTCGYDPAKLFNKLFNDDIKYLLSMDKLWTKRRPPQPLEWDDLPDAVASCSVDESGSRLPDQELWSIQECADVFKRSLLNLKNSFNSLPSGDHLVWDKDNKDSMDFITACTNIRAFIFGIQQKSRFDIKSMAGNIIPAIATTNAIIAGLIVLQSLKILNGKSRECSTVFLNKQANASKKILVPCQLVKPNKACYVCSSKPEVTIKLNVDTTTVKTFEEKILKGALHMVAPDVEIEDGKGTILISSEEGETEGNNDKMLSEFGIRNSSRLICDDFQQNFKIVVNLEQCEKLAEQVEFEVIGEVTKLVAEDSLNKEQNGETVKDVHSEDDLVVVVDIDDDVSRKRKLSTDEPQVEKRVRKDSSDVEVL